MPSSRRWPLLIGLLGIALTAGFFVYGLLIADDWRGFASSTFHAGFERANMRLGLGIDQVTVSGQRFTPDSDIFEALRLEDSGLFVTFDASAARARVELLPWVSRASVTRVYPGQLSIVVQERTAYALWHWDGDWFLIDRTGRVLSRVDQPLGSSLPVIHGAGAAEEAEMLVHLLGDWSYLAKRFQSGEWIAGRRWSLHLKNGSLVHLPADGAMSALKGFNVREDAEEILSKSDQIIDLRKRGYAFVRPKATVARSNRLRVSEDRRAGRDG